jgi:tetratricopeptide (TPR) repeat protein
VDLGWTLRSVQPKEAEKHCRQGFAIWDKLATDFPKVPLDRAAMGMAHEWLGLILLQAGRYQESESHLLQALRLQEQRLPGAGSVQYPPHLCASVGDLFYRTGRPAEAEKYYRMAVDTRQKIADAFPSSVTEQHRRLVIEYADLGKALIALGRTQEAEVALRRALANAKKLVSDHPGVPPFPQQLAWGFYDLACLLEATGRSQEAADSVRSALRIFESLVTEAPEQHRRNFWLAWVLVTCPAPQFRNPERAIELSKKALQVSPLSAEYWRTLGIAQCRTRSWHAAVEALSKAVEVGHGGDSREWFFLAMAHWQLGDKKEASRRYKQAVEWMEKHVPGDEELRRFRSEAAQLLGVEGKNR